MMGIRIPVEKIRMINITDIGLINNKSSNFLSSFPIFDMYKISWKRHCTYVLDAYILVRLFFVFIYFGFLLFRNL